MSDSETVAKDEQFYRVEEVIRPEVACKCSACMQWTIVYDDGEPIEIGTSWEGADGKESAEDICDLMNMAFDRGAESTLSRDGEAEAEPRCDCATTHYEGCEYAKWAKTHLSLGEPKEN